MKRDGSLPAQGACQLLRPRCLWFVFAVALLLPAWPRLLAQGASGIDDITGRYHFLGPQDTLAILEEEGQLKGYIDVFQSEDESDAILSYPIVSGTRQGDQVEFKTAKIHEKYFRFTGTIERGSGRKADDSDYMHLAGDLETITSNAVTGKEDDQHKKVVFKLKGKAELEEEREER